MEKYHKTDISPVEKENERDETYEAQNPQIDCERTSNNYHTVRRDKSYTEYINKRLEEKNIKPRKDAVLMCSFVISSDKTFFESLTEIEERNSFTTLRVTLQINTEEKILFPPSSTKTKPLRIYT